MGTRVPVRDRWQITLPLKIREALSVEPGDELEFEVADDGTVRVHVLKVTDDDQAWFWTEEWQAGEREADEDIAKGRLTFFGSDEEFLASLLEQ